MMEEEENNKEEFDRRNLFIVLLLYFPTAFIDSIFYYITGTSWGSQLFNLSGLFYPVWEFWGGLVFTIIEIYLVFHYRKKLISWLKANLHNRQSEIKKGNQLEVFISYAFEDLKKFRIPEIADFLENQSRIRKVYYWERDNRSSQTLVEYMEQSILKSDIVLIICSQNSKVSSPVNKEIDFAVVKDKKIIPIFDDIDNVREFIKVHRGVKFSTTHFNVFLKSLMSVIKDAI